MEVWHIETRYGVRIAAPGNLNSMTAYVLLEQEDWFEQEMNFVRAYIEPGMHIVDVGANHGVYSLTVANRLEGRGHVWSFEPAKAPYSMLLESIRANGHDRLITPLQVGLSDRARIAHMAISEHSELNSLHGNSSATESIQLDTLDSVLPARTAGANIDFVKLDAEGEEVNILGGGDLFFARQSPLVMFEIRHGTQFNHGLMEAFIQRGYGLYRHLPGLNILVPIEMDGAFDGHQLNLFAAKPDRALLLELRGLLSPTLAPTGEVTTLESWQDGLERLPFARRFMRAWSAEMRESSASARRHGAALGAYFSSQDSSRPAAYRLTCLQRALEEWQSLSDHRPWQLSFSLCSARALSDLGRRNDALRCLIDVWRMMNNASLKAFSLPFLPPLKEFDDRVPKGEMLDWLMAAMIEAYESWRLFSSYFGSDSSMLLAAHMRNADVSRAMRRRFVLHACRGGDQVVLGGNDVLLKADAEHRNIEFWRRFQQPSSASLATSPALAERAASGS